MKSRTSYDRLCEELLDTDFSIELFLCYSVATDHGIGIVEASLNCLEIDLSGLLDDLLCAQPLGWDATSFVMLVKHGSPSRSAQSHFDGHLAAHQEEALAFGRRAIGLGILRKISPVEGPPDRGDQNCEIFPKLRSDGSRLKSGNLST